ncbi:hypothetical protein [uncultured Microbulbifer sp.]|uniref:hypothetical protein n=1 Tax=uncultured Microbulbifer sp. TaxID=348147 RepID=UPI002629FF68|nr:hypothetical protein [uncultured Microbulbifer sp.]
MSYLYHYTDNNHRITDGALNQLNFHSVIQEDDGFGGYNTKFTVTNSLCVYHVHFYANGTRISVIRHKPSDSAEGTNIIECTKAKYKKTFSDLQHKCNGYANHMLLMQNFRNAIAGLQRNGRNELTNP